MKRSQQKFAVHGEAVQNVVEYMYLGCTINEYAKCRVMVNYKAKAGARALCMWLRKCKIAIGEVNGESFMRLLEALVDSLLLYGAEVWGCCRQTNPLVQVQLRESFWGWVDCIQEVQLSMK